MVDVWRQPDAHTYDSELTVVVNSIVLVSVESDSSLIGVEGGSWELNKAILIFARSFRWAGLGCGDQFPELTKK